MVVLAPLNQQERSLGLSEQHVALGQEVLPTDTDTHRDTHRVTHKETHTESHTKRHRQRHTHRAGRCPYKSLSSPFPCLSSKTWWEAWTDSDGFRRRIRRVWPRIFARIGEAPQNRRWRRTHGPIGGIIATLTEHGWDASQPERLTSSDGTTFLLSEPAFLSDPSPLFPLLRGQPLGRILAGR